MKVLVFCEQRDGKFKSYNYEALSSALQLAGDDASKVACLLIGKGLSTHAQKLQKWSGNIYSVEAFDHYNPSDYTKALETAIKTFSPDVVLGIASPMGRDLFARCSARLSAPLMTDLVEISIVDGKFVGGLKPMFAGKILANLRYKTDKIKFATLRPNVFAAKAESSLNGSGQIHALACEADNSSRIKTIEIRKGKSEKPDLTEAVRIVSGGRALGSAENFAIISSCAEVLGATVGASRAAVDSGYASHEMQVGQTGKTVNPTLYIACGISGSIQHMAGMRTSKVIVAVNTDPEAPIFSVATYGIVADLFEVVPMMSKKLKTLLDA